MQTQLIEWDELRSKFMDCVQDGKPWTGGMAGPLAGFHAAPYADSSFYGGAPADTLRWLRDGFDSEAFAAAAGTAPQAPDRKVTWSDEDGDPDVGRLIGGWDDFYFAVDNADAKPPLRVNVAMDFSAMVSAETVAKYGAWVARLVLGLENAGYDLEVNIMSPGQGVWVGGGKFSTLVRVKRAGELSHFRDWSALFAPTGYRHLIFTSIALGAERFGKVATTGLGGPIASEWTVKHDPASETLEVRANPFSSSFDGAKLDAALAKTGLLT